MKRHRQQDDLIDRYYLGEISVEEFVKQLIQENEFDQERRELVRKARKVAGMKAIRAISL